MYRVELMAHAPTTCRGAIPGPTSQHKTDESIQGWSKQLLVRLTVYGHFMVVVVFPAHQCGRFRVTQQLLAHVVRPTIKVNLESN